MIKHDESYKFGRIPDEKSGEITVFTYILQLGHFVEKLQFNLHYCCGSSELFQRQGMNARTRVTGNCNIKKYGCITDFGNLLRFCTMSPEKSKVFR